MRKNRILIILFIIPLLIFSCARRETGEIPKNLEHASWPIFRGDAQLSGIAQDPLPDALSLLWSFKTESAVISSPVVGLGRVFVGSTDGKVYALNLADGKPDWSYDTGDDIEASPLFLDQTVFIGSLSGDFFALDAVTGQMKWKYAIESDLMGSANWAVSEDGREKWILVGSYDASLYCFEAGSGDLKWTYETDNYINGTPAVHGNLTVVGGCDEILHIISVSDGRETGGVNTGSYIPGSAAFVDGRAYVGHYGSKFLCIDIPEKRIVWEYENEKNGAPFFSSPAVSGDRVVVGSRDEFLHCIHRETGERIWTFRTRGEVDSSPVIAGESVVTASADGRLYIVDLETGKETWSYEIGASMTGCPAVTAGMIVIGAEDGSIYAFGESQ